MADTDKNTFPIASGLRGYNGEEGVDHDKAIELIQILLRGHKNSADSGLLGHLFGDPYDTDDGVAEAIVDQLPESAMFESVINALDYRPVLEQIATTDKGQRGKTARRFLDNAETAVKVQAQEAAKASNVNGAAEVDKFITDYTSHGRSGALQINQAVGQATRAGLGGTDPVAAAGADQTPGTADDINFDEVAGAGASATPWTPDQLREAAIGAASGVPAISDFVRAEATGPPGSSLQLGMGGIGDIRRTPGAGAGEAARAGRTVAGAKVKMSAAQSLNFINDLSDSEYAALEQNLHAAGYYDRVGQASAGTGFGVDVDATTLAWQALLGDSGRAGVDPATMLAQQKMAFKDWQTKTGNEPLFDAQGRRTTTTDGQKITYGPNGEVSVSSATDEHHPLSDPVGIIEDATSRAHTLLGIDNLSDEQKMFVVDQVHHAEKQWDLDNAESQRTGRQITEFDGGALVNSIVRMWQPREGEGDVVTPKTLLGRIKWAESPTYEDKTPKVRETPYVRRVPGPVTPTQGVS